MTNCLTSVIPDIPSGFFRALAERCRELAIGIVLCGTGTHGDLGLSEIRRLVMVQDPDTGVHYQMP